MLKEYYRLAKPGIVYGNLLTTLAAYLYASRWMLVSWPVWINFLATIAGLGLVIASACVFNNYYDRDIDAKMVRTKDRALVSGAISNTNAILFGAILCLVGFALLFAFVNIITAFVASVGFVVYVFVYTFAKYKTGWATEIGSIAGATPIVAGYTAVVNGFDTTALILFIILVVWQMPHFFAIAFYREPEYAAAGIPVPPLKRGAWQTKLQTSLYILAFGIAVLLFTVLGYAGFLYLTVVEIAALVWFLQSAEAFEEDENEHVGKKLFFTSLVVLVMFSIMLALASILP